MHTGERYLYQRRHRPTGTVDHRHEDTPSHIRGSDRSLRTLGAFRQKRSFWKLKNVQCPHQVVISLQELTMVAFSSHVKRDWRDRTAVVYHNDTQVAKISKRTCTAQETLNQKQTVSDQGPLYASANINDRMTKVINELHFSPTSLWQPAEWTILKLKINAPGSPFARHWHRRNVVLDRKSGQPIRGSFHRAFVMGLTMKDYRTPAGLQLNEKVAPLC